MDFICPRCRGELIPLGNMKKCPSGHSFDRAREGYFNLLLSSARGVHGDNCEMVAARRAFLSLGYYLPMAKRLTELVLLYTRRGGTVLDSGLGEGYYTDIIENALYERDGESAVFGFDISKDAVRLAAKKNKRLALSVASAYDMPVADGMVDTVVNVFSPLAISEVLRVSAPRGKFIMVYPAENHLFGLKKLIYDVPYKNTPQPAGIDGFKLISHEGLSYEMHLKNNAEVRALFMMTPYAYRTPKEARERVLALDTVLTEADFYIDVYEREDK